MKHEGTTWFILRREPLYHKLQYSKVQKYDSSAAILGTVIGAFGGYLALASVGSGGTDLTDLTTLAAWSLVFFCIIFWSMELRNAYSFIAIAPLSVWVRPLMALILPTLSLGKLSRPFSGGVRSPREEPSDEEEGGEERFTDDELTDIED
jgi:hypothetical protein